jgi:hypothetical protein
MIVMIAPRLSDPRQVPVIKGWVMAPRLCSTMLASFRAQKSPICSYFAAGPACHFWLKYDEIRLFLLGQ